MSKKEDKKSISETDEPKFPPEPIVVVDFFRSLSDGESTLLFGSMPRNSRAALAVVRRWQEIPDNVSDEDALAKGFITPAMLELIMQIVLDLMQNCMSNHPASAWRRVQGYVQETKELNRIGDSVRLGWAIDRWLNRMGHPRDRGDVVEIRQAITLELSGLKEEDFRSLQTEILFLTV